MTYSEHNQTYILRLMPGEELFTMLTMFCENKHITGGWISGLGGARLVELAAFDLGTKTYGTKILEGNVLEVTNLTGNIAIGKIHVHATIGDHDFKAWTGHANKIIADPTLELYITQLAPLQREFDDYCGLQLLQLKENSSNT